MANPDPNPLPRGRGRPLGSTNKVPSLIKESILKSLANSDGGATGYFDWLKIQHPASFSTLVAKIIPTQVEGSGEDGKIVISWSNE